MNAEAVKRGVLRGAVVLLLAAGCKQDAPPPPPAEPAAEPAAESAAPAAPASDGAAAEPERENPFRDFEWSAVSQDGSAVLTQIADARGKCRRSCSDAPNGAEVWGEDGCIGKKIDLRYVANDCAKVIVLHQLPETTANSTQWPSVEVGHVYNQGKLDYAIAAAGAVRDFKKIRSAGNTFYWLAGALDQPGQPPRYSADGNAVEFSTLDGASHKIPLTPKKK